MGSRIINSQRCPYVGLVPYSEEDAPFFFGREREREIITANLFSSRLTLLYGASGVGKSSVLRAGVAHHLHQRYGRNRDKRGSTEFAVVYFNSWTDDPLASLTEEIRKMAARVSNKEVDGLFPPGRDWDLALEDFTDIIGGQLLIILDQFEDFFQYHRHEDAEKTFAYQFPKAVNRPDLRANFLISIREDALAKLDRFKGVIPELFENYLRIDHLSHEAAREAIERPIEAHNRLYATPGEEISIEPSLVDAVLEQVETGRDIWRETGNKTEGIGKKISQADTFIETPYLQLVMTRLWDEEMRDSSRKLQLDTLSRLGGAEDIVRTHLDNVMSTLTADEQEAGARAFYHLVTPSGAKIAHKISDLMEFTELSRKRLIPLLEKLSGQNNRILRPIAPSPDQPASHVRYEIFHDVLAKAILDWRTRFVQKKEKERMAREASEREKESLQKIEVERKRNQEQVRINKKLRLQRAALALVSIILCYILGRIGWNYHSKFMKHVEYYNSFEKKNGMPIGIGKLTAEQVRHRAISYKLIRWGHNSPVTELVVVNSNGDPTSHHGIGTYLESNPKSTSPRKECKYEFVTERDKQIVYEKAYDKYGELVWGFVYSPREPNARSAHAHFVGPDGYPKPRTNTTADVVKFEYSAEGYEETRHYFDRNRNPQLGPDKAYGQRREFDQQGRVVALTSLGRDGKNAMNDNAGNAILRCTYDNLGDVVKAVAFDASNIITTVKDGWAICRQQYDSFGNQIEQTYFSISDQPIFHNDGYHRVTVKYDDGGNLIEWTYFDTTGKPTALKDGYHRATAKYDKGNWIEWACFDTAGKPTTLKDSYHRATSKYDNNGNHTEWAYFDTAGKPITLKDGYHRATSKYDDNGNLIEWAYFDTAGKPTAIKLGYHKATVKYDDRSNRIEWAYFDTAGKPTIDNSNGKHKVVVEYDERGRQTAWAYFDTAGKPTETKDGYHQEVTKYDDNGNRIEWAFFDTAGKPTIDISDGTHKLVAEYDERGNQTAWAYFDTAGKPITLKDGYHRATAKYDDNGNRIEWAFFDTAGKPTIYISNGTHKLVAEYDERGNQTAWTYFDTMGKPTDTKEGYHRKVAKYDDKGNWIKSAYFDTSGKLIN